MTRPLPARAVPNRPTWRPWRTAARLVATCCMVVPVVGGVVSPPPVVATELLTPATAVAIGGELAAGSDAVEERAAAGSERGATVCDDGSQPAAIDLACSSTTTVVPRRADLAVAIRSGVDVVGPGDTFVWTVDVTNSGPDRADGVAVTDTIPAELAVLGITSAELACELADHAVTCAIDALEVGTSGSVLIVVEVPEDAATDAVANTASVSASTDDPDLTDNSADSSVDVVAQLAPSPPTTAPPTTAPPTTAPPTTAPPTTAPPATASPTAGPTTTTPRTTTPPTTAPATSVASAPPTSVESAAPIAVLPTTGSGGTSLMVVAGLSLLAAGSVALASVRRDDPGPFAHPPG